MEIETNKRYSFPYYYDKKGHKVIHRICVKGKDLKQWQIKFLEDEREKLSEM